MRFRASDIATAVRGRLVGPDVDLDGVSFDSRSICAGQLFVPLIAERDGHDFILAARLAGAAAYLTARAADGGTAIEVDDTLRALMGVAQRCRETFAGAVIGITGSVGKTSTKDMARAALSASMRTSASQRSFNNDQGLPTTILNTPDDAEVMVLEMGMRGPGEIARLCRIARPNIGVVTRVAEAHGELVGGIEGIARAKAELIESLPGDGHAILNGDDDRVRSMRVFTEAAALTFGTGPQNDVSADDVVLDELARPRFRLRSPWGDADVRVGASGRHMVANALAALSCVGVLGGDLAAAADALANFELSSMRMQILRAPSGAVIVDDSYNASPTSMRAAIDALASMSAVHRFAVLGMMAEISDPEAEHAAIGTYARKHDVQVIAVGTDLYGIPPVLDAGIALGDLARGDAVLVKGSRVVGLERVVDGLVAGGRNSAIEPGDVAPERQEQRPQRAAE